MGNEIDWCGGGVCGLLLVCDVSEVGGLCLVNGECKRGVELEEV